MDIQISSNFVSIARLSDDPCRGPHIFHDSPPPQSTLPLSSPSPTRRRRSPVPTSQERFLFHQTGDDAAAMAKLMGNFEATNQLLPPAELLAAARSEMVQHAASKIVAVGRPSAPSGSRPPPTHTHTMRLGAVRG